MPLRRYFIGIAFSLNFCLTGAGVNGVFSSSAYTFSRQDLNDSTLTHVRLYQTFLVHGSDLLLKNSRLNFSGVFYTDPVNTFSNEPVFQLHNLNYTTFWFKRKFALVVGRQFKYSVSDAGRLDGLSARYRWKKLDIHGFMGAYVPASGLTDKPMDNLFMGFEMGWKPSTTMALKVGMSDKQHSRPVYRSPRMGKRIEVPPSIKRRLGLQARWQRNGLAVYFRSRHQLRQFQLADLLIQTSYQGSRLQPFKNLVLEYNLREPRIPENSIFSVFNSHSSQELRLSGQVLLTKDITGKFQLRQVFFQGDQATIVSLGAGNRTYQVSVIHQEGYGGSSNRLTAGQFVTIGKLNLTSRITVGNYRLLEGSWDDLATVALRASYPLWKKITVDSEMDVLRNKYYRRDIRFLLGLRYRL
ncbi:MAG: hypothetical protein ACE5D2_08825 [Fidelibacterota bacterium]